jgi:hypothetical protein
MLAAVYSVLFTVIVRTLCLRRGFLGNVLHAQGLLTVKNWPGDKARRRVETEPLHEEQGGRAFWWVAGF